MKKNKRIPIGVSAEKKGNEFEIRLYYEPNIFIDGPEFVKFDKVYKIPFTTKFRFIANWYVRYIAKKYNFHYQIQQENNTKSYNGAFNNKGSI